MSNKKTCNWFCNIGAKQVEQRCCVFYHPRKKPCNLICYKTGSNLFCTNVSKQVARFSLLSVLLQHSQQRKNTLHIQHTFFVHFFCRCFARLQRETSQLHFLWRKCRMCSCSIFSFFLLVCRSFSPGWPLAFLIFSPPLQKFLFFPPTIFVSLCFISRSSSFSVIHVSGNLVEKKTRL